jgi:hypothetical protein
VNSWGREKITEAVKSAADRYGFNNLQQCRQLAVECSGAPSREVFFGLFSFFFDPSLQENKFERQRLAGKLLLSVAPPSPLALDGSVFAAATIWDRGVEDLPRYWCRNFGKQVVVEFLSELVDDCEDPGLKSNVETMLLLAHAYGNGT